MGLRKLAICSPGAVLAWHRAAHGVIRFEEGQLTLPPLSWRLAPRPLITQFPTHDIVILSEELSEKLSEHGV